MTYAKKLLKFLVFNLIKLVDIFIPKKKDLWVFANRDRRYWEGNLRAVFELVKNETEVRGVILNRGSITCLDIESLYDTPVLVVHTITFLGLWLLLRARVVFITHGTADVYWPFCTKQRLLVNLWHGIPLKGIGYFEANADAKRHDRLRKEKKMYDFVVSSSEIDLLAMMACFNLKPSKVRLTGLPRNDWLMQESKKLPVDLRVMETKLKDLIGGRRLVLYAPTFRDTHSGLYAFDREELKSLSTLLNDKNAVLGIRSHVKKETKDYPPYTEGSEFLDLSYLVCPETQVLLRLVDVLVTDYSGIWLDFLLMQGRPIIGFVYDWDAYLKERGFLYNYKKLFPGPLVYEYATFRNALEEALDLGVSMEMQVRYDLALDMFHTYLDGYASQRVLEMIKREIE